jgi:hypothetical protein
MVIGPPHVPSGALAIPNSPKVEAIPKFAAKHMPEVAPCNSAHQKPLADRVKRAAYASVARALDQRTAR